MLVELLLVVHLSAGSPVAEHAPSTFGDAGEALLSFLVPFVLVDSSTFSKRSQEKSGEKVGTGDYGSLVRDRLGSFNYSWKGRRREQADEE